MPIITRSKLVNGSSNFTVNSGGTAFLEVAGQTVGNARGAGAFDWQAVRTSASTVASGASAVTFGARTTAGGDYSFSHGFVTSSSGNSSFSVGRYSLAANYYQVAFGGGIAAAGQSQGSLQTMYTATSDSTPTQLNITGTATDRVVIPATRAITFIGTVTAMCNVSSSSNFVKSWRIEGCITRDGSNTTRIVGVPIVAVVAQDTDGTPTPSKWAIEVTADDTNEALAITATGQAATAIRWQVTMIYGQIGF